MKFPESSQASRKVSLETVRGMSPKAGFGTHLRICSIKGNDYHIEDNDGMENVIGLDDMIIDLPAINLGLRTFLPGICTQSPYEIVD